MISAANLSIQFGAKPLFENVSVTFGNGHRYGLIGANGSGKSTFMKILAGELEPSAGNVSTEPHVRVMADLVLAPHSSAGTTTCVDEPLWIVNSIGRALPRSVNRRRYSPVARCNSSGRSAYPA